MKVSDEISLSKMIRFGIFEILMIGYKFLAAPPLRKAFLKFCGVRIGDGTIIHDTTFFNLYRVGFKGLTIGKKCFIGNECMFDLAEEIILEDNVTLAERVTILTHTNVGYKDHPLQKQFPKSEKYVSILEGSFIGANVTILEGVTVGTESFVAAGSVVTKNVPNYTLVAGNPAREIKKLKC